MNLLLIRRLLPGFCFFLSLVSCNKEQDPPIQPPDCLLTSVHESNLNKVTTYEYNKAYQLVKRRTFFRLSDTVDYDFHDSVVYNRNGQIVRVLHYDNNKSAPGAVTFFDYSNNGRTVTIHTDSPYDYLYVSQLTFNDSSQLLTYTSQHVATKETSFSRYEYDAKGNLQYRVDGGELNDKRTSHLYYKWDDFDTKKSPYSSSPTLRMYCQLLSKKPINTYHNDLQFTRLDTSGATFSTTTYSNVYNDKDYLSSSQSTVTYKNASYNETTTYSYSCP